MVKKKCKCKCPKGSRRARELTDEERRSYSLQSKILMDKFKKDFPDIKY